MSLLLSFPVCNWFDNHGVFEFFFNVKYIYFAVTKQGNLIPQTPTLLLSFLMVLKFSCKCYM